MLNFNQLRAFYCVAKNISFRKAAEELFVTQPAVSAQVKHFEEWCELKLFKKRGHSIALTDVGEILYQKTSRIFENEKELELIFDNYRKDKQGVLRIGVDKEFSHSLMPHITLRFQEKYQKIKMCMGEGSSRQMIKSVLNLENEIAVVADVIKHNDLQEETFSREEIIPIFHPHHPFAFQTTVSVERLTKEPIIMREVGSGTRKCVDKLFSKYKCKPNILMETPNTFLIKQLAENGDGIALLPKASVLLEIQTSKLVTRPIQREEIYLDGKVYYLKNTSLSTAAKDFINILVDQKEFIPSLEKVSGISVKAPMMTP